MQACVILYNMIVEDNRYSYDLAIEYDDMLYNNSQPNVRWDHHPLSCRLPS